MVVSLMIKSVKSLIFNDEQRRNGVLSCHSVAKILASKKRMDKMIRPKKNKSGRPWRIWNKTVSYYTHTHTHAAAAAAAAAVKTCFAVVADRVQFVYVADVANGTNLYIL